MWLFYIKSNLDRYCERCSLKYGILHSYYLLGVQHFQMENYYRGFAIKIHASMKDHFPALIHKREIW